MTTVVPLTDTRQPSPYPLCPGCRHSRIRDALNKALALLQLDPGRAVLVSDIGCVGFAAECFETNTFQGPRGRSITYASGIKLARPDLKVVVAMGDRGCSSGGMHLSNAARRNIGITVLVCNNLSPGLTGAEDSVTTPRGSMVTSSTEDLERHLDICGMVAVNGAGYVYRGTVDRDLPERIAEAMAHDGFSLLDVWETCTASLGRPNALSRSALCSTLQRLELPTGVLHFEERPEYARALREAGGRAQQGDDPRPLTPRYVSGVTRRTRLVVAGSAGGAVAAATRLGGLAAVLSGLHAAQRDNAPLTVKAGRSLSELVLDTRPVEYGAIAKPEVAVVVSAAGLEKAGRYLEAMGPEDRLFVTPELAEAATRAKKTVIEAQPSGAGISQESTALMVLTAALTSLQVVSAQALAAAAKEDGGRTAGENLKAIAAGVRLGRGAQERRPGTY